MEQHAKEFLSWLRHYMPRSTYALAVSGGPDSMGLLALGAQLQRAKDAPRFLVLHVNHGLNAQSDAWQAQVLAQAKALGLAAHSLRWAGKKPTTGLQERARAARYKLMAQACARHGIDGLVTAHHLEDQAETVLLRLTRGSSLAGLGAMRAKQNYDGLWLLRPFLDWPKARLRACANAAGLPIIADAANMDRRYARARMRHHADALQAVGLTPEALQRFAQKMQRAQEALAHQTHIALHQLCVQDNYGVVHIQKHEFLALPKDIAYRMLQQILVRKAAYPIREHQLARLHTGLMQHTQSAFSLAGFIVRARTHHILVYREPRYALALAPHTVQQGEAVVWDERLVVSPPAYGRLAVLGEGGLAWLKAQAQHLPSLPRQALLTSPALWRARRLLASPLCATPRHLPVQPLPL